MAAQRDGDRETVVAKVFSALDRGSNVALCGEGEDTLAMALVVTTADDSKLDRVAECWREVLAATRGETSAGIDGLFEYDLQYVGKTQGRVPPSSMASLRLLVELGEILPPEGSLPEEGPANPAEQNGGPSAQPVPASKAIAGESSASSSSSRAPTLYFGPHRGRLPNDVAVPAVCVTFMLSKEKEGTAESVLVALDLQDAEALTLTPRRLVSGVFETTEARIVVQRAVSVLRGDDGNKE